MENKISQEEAKQLLWHQGVLIWLLYPVQKELYESYINCKDKIIVWNCSRRLGKSYALSVIAVETCLKKPNALVKYCCAKQKDAKNIIRPLIREIIETCPVELKPEFKTQDGDWVFPNGSRIQLTGLDAGRAESVRGGSSDLCIIDEAGLIDDLPYIITSIILPTTSTTKGKVILASTPPKSPNHPFITRYLNKARIEGNLVTKTIYDNPNIDKDEFDKLVDESGGLDSIDFQREYLCVDEDTLIKTKNGYQKIKNIIVGTEVFTHEGRYKKVLNVFKNKRNNRKVYKVTSSNNVGHIVTEGHKLYISTTNYERDLNTSRTEWTEVENIKCRPSERIYYKIPIDYRKNNTIDINKAYLAGWYVAEGHCATKAQQVGLSLSLKDPIAEINKASEIVFNKKFVNYSIVENCWQWYLNSKVGKEYFKQFGTHSTKKRVIDEIKYGSEDVKRSFLNAYFLGDGHNYGDRITVSSVCLELLADVSDMLLSLNIPNQIQQNVKEGPSVILGRKVNVHNGYALTISGKNYQKYMNMDITARSSTSLIEDGHYYSRIKKIEEIKDYKKEYVYDIEVDSDHSYVGLHGTFHNCRVIVDDNFAIIPEFSKAKDAIVKEWERPAFYDSYVSMDVGMKDLTVVLFAWYDFLNSKVVIEDEFVINGQKLNTNTLAAGIKQIENKNFTDQLTGEKQEPYLRVSDNNLIVIKDLWDLHALRFLPTRKDDADAALNKVRIMIQNEEIIINPRCKTLIMHLEAGIWNKGKTSFERSADMGHFDAIDSLKYLIRNVQTTKNPYPSHYFAGNTSNQFRLNSPKPVEQSAWGTVMNIKKKEPTQQDVVKIFNNRPKFKRN